MDFAAECLQFNFGTIRVATNDFSDENKLGQGGFSAVYRVMKPRYIKIDIDIDIASTSATFKFTYIFISY